MTSRPTTSKPRGVCKYYNAGPRGCLAGNSCKFLHGEEKLSPFDQAKECKFYAAGYCKRGSSCWFKHTMPDPRSFLVDEHPPPPTEDVCGICLEQPVTFGLLSHCTHAFCLECVKQWRDQKNNQDDPDGEAHRANKRCPYCRTLSSLVIPSSHYYPQGHPGKAAALKRYKQSTSRVPCKHFKASPPHDRYCPFGSDCLYKHENPDGTPYVFNRGVDHYMPQLAARRLRNQASNPPDALDNPFRENLNLFFRDVRAVLGEYFNVVQEGSPVHDIGSEVATPAAAEHILDVLANELSIAQLWESEEYDDTLAGSPVVSETVIPPPHRNTAQWGAQSAADPAVQVRFDWPAMQRRNGDTASNADSMPSLEDVSDSSYEESDENSGSSSSDDSPAHSSDTRELCEDTSFSRIADAPVGSSVLSVNAEAIAASTTSLTPVVHDHPSTSSGIRHADPPPLLNTPCNVLALGDAASAAPRTEQAPAITSPVAGLAAPPSSPSPEALPEPPFMTDGRGRVVWSRAGVKRGQPDSASSTSAATPVSALAVAEHPGSSTDSSSHHSNTSP